MRAVVAADDTGGLKEIVFPQGTDTSVQDAPQPETMTNHAEQGRRNRVDKLQVFKLPSDSDTRVLAVARRNETVELYRLSDFELLHTWPPKVNNTSLIVGLEVVSGKLVTANEDGMVVIRDLSDFQSVKTLSLNRDQLTVFRSCQSKSGIFAYGGKDRDVEIVEIDLDTGKLSNIFKGKNVKNDKLDLQVPIHITDIKFLCTGDDKGYRFATSTKFGQIRIYDTTKGRRPTQDIQVTPNGIKLLADAAEETDVIYSDTHMTTALFSLDRKQKRGNFAGFTGNTQGVHSYEGRLLAAGGWDRYLRVFDLKSREPVAKIFTGCEISAVIVLEDDIRKREIEDDELWDKLDSATTKSRSKKQKVTKA